AGTSNFIVSYGASGCTVSVTVATTLGAFTLNGSPGGCMGATPSGTYTKGVALDPTTNTVTININVTALGAYSITSPVTNGMTFSNSGTFTTTGPLAIVLAGSGTPAASGSTNVPLTAGGTNCSFNLTVVDPTVAPATFTITCPSTTVNGNYTAG